MLFHQERRALAALGLQPQVLVDPSAPVTTPYDVMINQQLEAARGADRHGSCGIGFGETIERIENSAFGLSVIDLLEPAVLIERLDQIRSRYLPARLDRLKLKPLNQQLLGDDIFERFIDDALCFTEHVTLRDISALDTGSSKLVFACQPSCSRALVGSASRVSTSAGRMKRGSVFTKSAGSRPTWAKA